MILHNFLKNASISDRKIKFIEEIILETAEIKNRIMIVNKTYLL